MISISISVMLVCYCMRANSITHLFKRNRMNPLKSVKLSIPAFKLTTLALIISQSISFNVLAQQHEIADSSQEDSGDNASIELENEADRVQELERIYVYGNTTNSYSDPATKSATKFVLSLRETPQSVSVITNQQLQDWQAVNITDILQHSTGFHATSTGSLDRPSYNIRGGEVNRIQIDGVQQFGGGRRPDVDGDSVAYERVEILRGANGLMTGEGEPTATVNIVRKRATSKEFQGSVAASLGRWDHYRVETDISTPLTSDGRIRGRVAAAYNDKDSYIERYGQEKTSLYVTAEADLTDYTLLRIGYEYADTSQRGAMNSHNQPYFFNDGSKVKVGPGKTGMSATWSAWPLTEHTAFASIDHSFESGWLLNAMATYNTIDMEGGHLMFLWYDDFLNPDGSGTFGANWVMPGGEDEQVTFDFTLQGPVDLFGRTHEVIIGYSMNDRESVGFGTKSSNVSSIPDNPNWFTWDGKLPRYDFKRLGRSYVNTTDTSGFFAATRVNLHDDFKLITGLRTTNWRYTSDSYDPLTNQFVKQRDNREIDNEITPYAGLVYDLNEDFSIYTSYTDAFRPQRVYDANDNLLDAVTGQSYEIGLKAELLEGALNFSSALFRIIENGVAERDPRFDQNYQTAQGNTPYRVRGDGGETSGFEAEVSGAISDGWNIYSGVSYTQTEDNDGERINTEIPKVLFNVYSTYDFSELVDGLTIGLGINYKSKYYVEHGRPTGQFDSNGSSITTPYRIEQSGVTLVNLMARYDVTDDLIVNLNIDNALDKDYYGAIATWSPTVVRGEPLSWNVGVRYSF